ncbi:MAG: hypothetical protein N4A33_00735 [Bacteriovoracaceae bacterium]|jgi:hypothetical protein|nr:hypothetical protein [Bacteriovoracaceae bacterium]
MKVMLLLLTLATFSSYGQINIENKQFNSIDKQQTCLDEYIEREQQLKKWLIWTPPLAVIGTPIAGVSAMVATSGLTTILNIQGWAALGWVIGGGMVATGAAAITAVTTEISNKIKFINNRRLIRAIVEAYNNNLNGKNLYKLTKKFNKRYKSKIKISQLIKVLTNLDKSQKLCDGSLKSKLRSYRLKHLLANKKDLFRYINSQLKLKTND